MHTFAISFIELEPNRVGIKTGGKVGFNWEGRKKANPRTEPPQNTLDQSHRMAQMQPGLIQRASER